MRKICGREKTGHAVKVSDTPGAENSYFYHLKMTASIIKDINMKK